MQYIIAAIHFAFAAFWALLGVASTTTDTSTAFNQVTLIIVAIIGFTSNVVVALIYARRTDFHFREIKTVNKATHDLVNDQMTVQLRLNADLRQQLADEHPRDKRLAEAARLAQAVARKSELSQAEGVGALPPNMPPPIDI